MPTNASAPLFPVFLKLAARPVVVVGGGSVATSKLDALLDAGAHVTVVAPEVTQRIAESGVAIHRRTFEPADLNGAWLVVAAASADINRAVSSAAEKRRVFVNAVDDPPNASAYLGGVFRRGGVTVAISTDGKAPALASLIRQALESLLPTPEVERWMTVARNERTRWVAAQVPIEERRPLLLRALGGLYDDREGE
ncbi:MAG: siroheme synthase [Acidobacteria bacterium]|nr:siroheme synthase [Acidobacteriota bacterium]